VILVNGGLLELSLDSIPNKNWGSGEAERTRIYN